MGEIWDSSYGNITFQKKKLKAPVFKFIVYICSSNLVMAGNTRAFLQLF